MLGSALLFQYSLSDSHMTTHTRKNLPLVEKSSYAPEMDVSKECFPLSLIGVNCFMQHVDQRQF